ncbi:bromodomain adjacent to zinc finger domain protein 2B isoform X7 [Venturia canescens]|uniref:bromodomain adjacent to zinc finger domain protein 2B isoform X7 n=1 Tax=Venturia canescens TaxID=32260 RepID=UPI001C9BF87B|nr:bromodomain adjacent to zinc finger domain protein 2B-like isoform X7 [Venturia canescens]
MEKENSASSGGGGGENTATVTGGGATSASEKLQADQANPLLDPSALFGAYWPRGDSAASSIFGGMPGGYGLSAHHLPSAYAILGRGGTAPGFGGHTPTSAPPPPPPYTHGSLGTLSVAASQAASLGINPASAAWWTMASHLAAQDYLARIQGAAGLPGFPPGAESLLPPYPASLLNPPSHSSHKSSKSKSSKSHKTSASSSNSGPPSSHTGSLAVSQAPITSSTHHSTSASSSCNTPTSQSQNVVSTSPPKEGSDPSSILGGVRLPPDTEIIKYTSSIVGPKIPGTTNRGRKKTISLDSPNVSVHAPPIQTMSAHQTNTTTTSMMIEPRKYNRTSGLQSEVNDYRESIDRVEVIKLPAHSTNGSVLSAPPIYTTCNTTNANINANDSDAPLNLSLKPASTSSNSPIPGSQPLSQLSNLSHSLLASDRTSRRKPGPKPRRVPQNSVAVPASPSPSLAQLFAAADSPQRPSSGSEESESTTTHHKDGRPRNLGRGVSKPKKNTVASLLAQSRALGIKPTPTLDPNAPLSHQVSLLRSNILAAQLHASATGQIDEKNQRSLQEKMKNKLLEASGEESNMDVTSESGSNTDVVTDTDEDNAEGTPSAKRRKLNPSEKDLQVPLERGWKRETVIKGLGKTGVIKGDVSYYSPCGKTFRSSPDLLKFLEQQNPAELTTANFSFSSRSLVGEFLQPTMGFAEAEFVRLGSQEVARRLDELRAAGGFRDARPNNQYERDKLAYAKKLAKEEAQRHKEQARLIKEQEKTERQEAVRRERELRNQQLLEARKKRQEEVEKIRMEEQQRKQQERELKRQQAVMLKEQERERRRQHMALVRALENRRKMEERERKRLEARAERIANKEKRAEQRKMELELVEQIRKPVEDMELTDHRPLPKIKRLPGLKLSGQAFSDIVMVFEFLHNFGETLGFDMESLPSLKSLQLALLNDEEAEEEMLSVMTHLLVCAIEDPGIPQPARHTTGLGQSLRQADITHANISEVLRIYLYANATGEVKALTGVCLERERDKRFADHHQNGGDYQSTGSGKNAQFYEHLHNNETWKMSERLRDKPFLALNPTHKAQMLAFLCNELLQNKAVIRQIEGSLENVAQLKKERFILDMKIRKLRQLHSRKVRMEAVGVIINKTGDTITIDKKEGEEGSEGTNAAPTATVGTTPTPDESNTHDETHDETEDMSENESEGTQPEEEEDKNLSGEELGKKLDKLLKQSEEQLQKLNQSSKSLRAHVFGQDRYWRRYWELPCAGGIFIEAMESAEPEILALQAELDEKWKGREIEKETENAEMIKAEDKVENKIDTENRENEAPNEVKQSNKFNEKENTDEVKAEDKQKIDHDEMNCKKSLQNSLNDETTTKSPKIDIKTENNDNSMSDAKTNVTSDEIKQETEIVPMEVDPKVEENVKKEHSEHSLKCETPKIVVKLMEDKIIETMPNGDKFNHINNSHNPKEINGTFMTAENTEPHWFSILPRETCDTPGPSTKQIFGIAEPTELRIPIFPPPASPNYDRCDSPAPLILTQEEAVQLEYLKIHGLPPPGEAKPVPKDYRHGWWRITDVDTFQELLEHLHSRGVREKELKRTTWATMESFLAVTGKIHVDPGNVAATELAAMSTDDAESTGIPSLDLPEDWSEQVALRVDAQLLEQVEALEDKVANASMQVKGWKLPPRAGTEEADEIEKLNEMEQVNAVEQARQRLLSLEAAIERRYLKPPLGICTGDPNLAALKAEQAAAANASLNSSDQGGSSLPPQEETTPRGLNNWREATARAHTSAQLAMALYMLEASIAWDKSIMKANCQFCHSGDNEDKLLLCDGCDRGYHTYCFRPKMENIPDGDWYCHECMNKATGERNCLVCGKRVGKNLVLCELCPRAYHTDCHNPVMPKIPRGKWYCSNCHSKQPKKRNSTRRSHSKGGGGGNSGGGGGGATAAATAAAAAAATGNASGGGASVGNNGSGSGAAPGGGSSGGAGGGSGNGSNAGGGGATSGGGSVTRDSESSDHPPASPTPSTASNTHVEEVSSSEPPTPTASPRKEASGASVVVGSTSGSGASGGGPGGAGSGNSNAGATSSTGTTTSGSGNSTGTGSTASSATGSGSASKTLTKKQQRELAPCKLLLEQLEQQDEAWPFLLPVNTKQFPTYKKIIKTPMDLSTIKKRLQDNVYKTRDEFCADVRQMFINCEVFNEDDSPVGKAGHGMRSFFEMRWTEITGSPPPPPPTHS